ncbi:unnamed protein product [Sympodiomycopsis kandeliae]
MSLLQPSIAFPAPGSTSSNRKRKEMMDDHMNGQAPMQIPERRKLALPRGSSAGNQVAMFHPLDAQDNLKMLANMGLISGPNASNAWSVGVNDSPKSTSSDSLPGTSDDGYFSAGHGQYPNVAPYGGQTFNQGQESSDMDIDPCAAKHGPSCTSLPQLYVSTESGSTLLARCRDCNFSWEVQSPSGPSHCLSYSP